MMRRPSGAATGMIFVLTALTFAAGAAAGELISAPGQPPLAPLSAATTGRLERASAALRETLAGRRLLAETADLARRESAAAGEDAVRFLRGPHPVLVFRPRRLPALSDPELELALARELARAAAALPVCVPEEDMAAYQTEIEYAMERSAGDEAFSQRLRQAYQVAARKDGDARAERRRVQALLPPG